MTAAAAIVDPQYSPSDFLEPTGLLINWPSSDHRNAQRVAKNVQILNAHLQYVADLRVSLTPKPIDASTDAQATQEAYDADMRMVLEAMRNLQSALANQIAARAICRDLKRFAPHLEKSFVELTRAASDHLREMRGILAFMLGEDDDSELEEPLVPDAGEPLPPEDSLPAPL